MAVSNVGGKKTTPCLTAKRKFTANKQCVFPPLSNVRYRHENVVLNSGERTVLSFSKCWLPPLRKHTIFMDLDNYCANTLTYPHR